MSKIIAATTSLTLLALGYSSTVLAAAPDIDGKVVLANLDRYDATIRVGKARRGIKPKKASVMTPKKYPATIEYWSGNNRVGWAKQTIPSAGIYGFNFKKGHWKLVPLKPGKTTCPAGTAARPTTQPQPGQTVVKNQTVVRQSAVQPAVGRRAGRLPMRRPINADRYRWSPLARVAWAAGSIYQFVRDEKDRDLLRDLLIYRRLDDIKAFDRWLDESELIATPHKEAIKEAFEDLADLKDEEWKEIETSDVKDWDKAKAEIGDLISNNDWKDLTDDLGEIDKGDFWEENADVDLDQVEFADNLDIDGDGELEFGDLGDLAENIDMGDIGIDSGSYDLAEFDDFGGGVADVGEIVGDAVGGLGEVVDDLGGGGFGGGFVPDDDMGDFGGDGFDFGNGGGFDDFGGGDFDDF